jgi:hypothetical protein
MARSPQATTESPLPPAEHPSQQRYTLAALIYFLYGLFYLLGAQYLTNMQAGRRGMASPALFFVLGGALALLFPWLIYRRWAIPLPLYWQPRVRRTTLRLDFTCLLGLLVILRVIALLRGGLFLKTWLHTMALAVTVLNATCLIWAGGTQPVRMTRTSGEST